MKMGNKYRMEVRIKGDTYLNGKVIPFMNSEGVDPIVIIRGDNIEDLFEELKELNNKLSTKKGYGKEDLQPVPVCVSEPIKWGDICSN